MSSTAPTWWMSWYGPVIIPSSIFVPEHVNKYSIIRIIRRPVLWKVFAVYDLVAISLRQRYCKLHVWLKLDLYVKDGSWVNLGISIGLDWFIWRPVAVDYYVIQNEIWNRCWSEVHLGIGHVLATADMSPRAIRYLLRYMDSCRLSRV